MKNKPPSGADARLDSLLPATTHTATETQELGRRLAAVLTPGDVVALYGNLGAGKTHFAKGICAALGIPEATVTSPTFTLINEYAGTTFPIYHFDTYRLLRLAEFYELGYEEYFFGDGICLVEWPEKIEDLLPDHTIRLRLTHLGGDHRHIACADGKRIGE